VIRCSQLTVDEVLCGHRVARADGVSVRGAGPCGPSRAARERKQRRHQRTGGPIPRTDGLAARGHVYTSVGCLLPERSRRQAWTRIRHSRPASSSARVDRCHSRAARRGVAPAAAQAAGTRDVRHRSTVDSQGVSNTMWPTCSLSVPDSRATALLADPRGGQLRRLISASSDCSASARSCAHRPHYPQFCWLVPRESPLANASDNRGASAGITTFCLLRICKRRVPFSKGQSGKRPVSGAVKHPICPSGRSGSARQR